MDKDALIKQLQEENSLLKYELEKTKYHLKKYTTHVFCNKKLISPEEKMNKLNRLMPASRL
jgi:hypothetical protein